MHRFDAERERKSELLYNSTIERSLGIVARASREDMLLRTLLAKFVMGRIVIYAPSVR